MALPSAGNETVGCPQRGERIATCEHEAANAGLHKRGLERARPAGEQEDGAGVPQAWVARVKRSMRTLIPRYSASRMVAEYEDGIYRSPVAAG